MKYTITVRQLQLIEVEAPTKEAAIELVKQQLDANAVVEIDVAEEVQNASN